MMRTPSMLSVLSIAILLPAGAVLAADQTQTQTQTQSQAQTQSQTRTQTQEQIYGSQLMTQQERVEYRSRMRAAKTAEERERIRLEHHEAMQERAKARGVTLPDVPPARGGGKGPGGGRGR